MWRMVSTSNSRATTTLKACSVVVALLRHVLTGDFSIIRDVKLRNLIRKGPVFRK